MLRQLISKSNKTGKSLRFFFSSSVEVESEQKKKSYRMPVEQQLQLYKPENPIRMHNHRVLLYLNKQKLVTPMMLQTPFATSFFGLIYLIRYNPWYLTFPASLPLMIGTQIFVFATWIMHKKHYKYIIERVYLYKGNFVEFTFSNKIRRRLKNTQGQHSFQNPEELKTPPHGENGELQWSQKGSPFPEKLRYKKNADNNKIEIETPQSPTFYGWTKYTSNYQPYLFPKNYQYANWQLLVPLFNGSFIDLSDSFNETHDLQPGEDHASFQQELKWIEEDTIKTQEALGQNRQEKQQNSN